MIHVHIVGHDIYEQVQMPIVPRKGEILWLRSLTLGASKIIEVQVSKVEWSRDQKAWITDEQNNGISAWLTVRRTNGKGKPVKEVEA